MLGLTPQRQMSPVGVLSAQELSGEGKSLEAQDQGRTAFRAFPLGAATTALPLGWSKSGTSELSRPVCVYSSDALNAALGVWSPGGVPRAEA